MKKLLLVLFCALAGCANNANHSDEISLATQYKKNKWPTPYGDGVVIATRHYKIFTTANRPELLASLPGFMEAAYLNYLTLTGLPDIDSTTSNSIYMMANRSQWMELTRRLVTENLDLYLSIETGGYCYRGLCVYWDARGIATYAVASHEGLHQFLGNRLKNRLPMWLEEGICATAEGFNLQRNTVSFTPSHNAIRMNSLRFAIVQGRQIELSRLLTMDAGDAMDGVTNDAAIEYYAQLWAMVQFIQSQPQYRSGLHKMFADAAAGNLQRTLNIDPDFYEQIKYDARQYNRIMSGPLFKKYIAADMPKFEKEYRQYSRKLVGLE